MAEQDLPRPLDGAIVLDLSRLLPGAVLARQLVDLGARVIKVEEPEHGDPMRSARPLIDGMGAGFRAFMRGTESLCLDLRTQHEVLGQLAERADVVIESFRPGTMARWGLGYEALHARNPRLIYCSLPGYGPDGADATTAAHDLNPMARSGLLSLLGPGMPRVQLADVTTGLLAANAIVAALLLRHRTGEGVHIIQALASGPLPFLAWAWADTVAFEAGAASDPIDLFDGLMRGLLPCYERYRCADGLELAFAAIEPKFWNETMRLMGLAELAHQAMASGPAGDAIRASLARAFLSRPRPEWLALFAPYQLPISPVATREEGRFDPIYLRHQEPMFPPPGATEFSIAPWVAGLNAATAPPAPALGAHTAALLAEFGSVVL